MIRPRWKGEGLQWCSESCWVFSLPDKSIQFHPNQSSIHARITLPGESFFFLSIKSGRENEIVMPFTATHWIRFKGLRGHVERQRYKCSHQCSEQYWDWTGTPVRSLCRENERFLPYVSNSVSSKFLEYSKPWYLSLFLPLFHISRRTVSPWPSFTCAHLALVFITRPADSTKSLTHHINNQLLCD